MFKRILGRNQKVKSQGDPIADKPTPADEEKQALYSSAHYKSTTTDATMANSRDQPTSNASPETLTGPHGKRGKSIVDEELGHQPASKVNDVDWSTNQTSQMNFNSTANEKMPLIQATNDDEYLRGNENDQSIANSGSENSPAKPRKRKKKKKKKPASVNRPDDLDSSAILR